MLARAPHARGVGAPWYFLGVGSRDRSGDGARSAPSDPSRVGTVIDSKYRLDQELGRGGMGAVYRAYHLRVHRELAIKVLLNEVAAHRSIASRFFLEAQAAGRIGHPGILDVYDVGEDADGTPYIVMELLRGEPLSALVRRERLDVDAACWIAMEVLDVLDAAHRAGIVHRDVKPQNVFLTATTASASPGAPDSARTTSRGVKLLDFGVAKFGGSGDVSALTRSGEIIGSPLYMAPEQAKGEPDLDARADVWSVGAMLFEMLTGKCAHAATTPVAVLAKILTEPAPLPSTKDDRIPADLDAVVARALRIDRSERFESARAMYDALDDVRKKRGTSGTTPALPAPPVKPASGSLPNDRTPGAITSTIAAPSDPPERPWSSRPAAPATSAHKDDDDGPNSARLSELRAAAEIGATTRESESASRSRLYMGAGAGVVGIGLVIWYMSAAPPPHKNKAPEPDETTSHATASPASRQDASVEAPLALSSGSASTSPPASASSPLAAPSIATATATTPPLGTTTAPKCAANEVISKGHCCARGLEWQGTHCERPLATTF